MADGDGALIQLRAWLAQQDPRENDRLPPERQLCEKLGVSRGELRKALKVLEGEGALWRQVGKGTFLGIRPADEYAALSSVARRSSPGEVMRARVNFEPMLAFEAAVNARPVDLEEMGKCIRAAATATTWRQYETADNAFHRSVAEATGNTVLIALFDQLNAVRRAVVWGRGRVGTERPPSDHHSFAEHQRILDAITGRDPKEAQAAMRAHLRSVESLLTEPSLAAQ